MIKDYGSLIAVYIYFFLYILVIQFPNKQGTPFAMNTEPKDKYLTGKNWKEKSYIFNDDYTKYMFPFSYLYQLKTWN